MSFWDVNHLSKVTGPSIWALQSGVIHVNFVGLPWQCVAQWESRYACVFSLLETLDAHLWRPSFSSSNLSTSSLSLNICVIYTSTSNWLIHSVSTIGGFSSIRSLACKLAMIISRLLSLNDSLDENLWSQINPWCGILHLHSLDLIIYVSIIIIPSIVNFIYIITNCIIYHY